jgi:hypothetical protein
MDLNLPDRPPNGVLGCDDPQTLTSEVSPSHTIVTDLVGCQGSLGSDVDAESDSDANHSVYTGYSFMNPHWKGAAADSGIATAVANLELQSISKAVPIYSRPASSIPSKSGTFQNALKLAKMKKEPLHSSTASNVASEGDDFKSSSTNALLELRKVEEDAIVLVSKTIEDKKQRAREKTTKTSSSAACDGVKTVFTLRNQPAMLSDDSQNAWQKLLREEEEQKSHVKAVISDKKSKARPRIEGKRGQP